jgi:hypothetical protein
MRTQLRIGAMTAALALAALVASPGAVSAQWRDDRAWDRPPYDSRGGRAAPGYRFSRGAEFGYQAGYVDGVEKGIEDARKRRAPDVHRHGWFREGDRRYRREYGPRALYRQAYRDGFASGYQRGYREAPRYGYRMPRFRDGFWFDFGVGFNRRF